MYQDQMLGKGYDDSSKWSVIMQTLACKYLPWCWWTKYDFTALIMIIMNNANKGKIPKCVNKVNYKHPCESS